MSIVLPSIGRSDYHAGTLRVEKRFAEGFSALATYTYAKFLTDTDAGGNDLGEISNYSNFYNRAADYGPSGNDIRHRLTLSSVYELPAGRGKRYLSSGLLAHLLGGWSVGVLGTLQSGPPSSLTTQTNTTNAFSAGALRANLVGDPELPASERTLTRWFNTEAFAQPAPFTFGNSPPGVLRGDGIIDFDISLAKNPWLAGDRFLQLGVELFNAFNHPNFGLPGHAFGAPNFGVVSDAGPGRMVQLGPRFVF